MSESKKSKKAEDGEFDEEEIAEDVKGLIRVEHTFQNKDGDSVPFMGDDEEKEDLKEKLKEREAQLALLALKQFNDEKDRVLELVPEDKREQAEKYIGNNPDRLQELQFKYGVLGEGDDDGAEPVPPKGKARGLLRKPKSGSETQSNVIGELYKIREKKAETPDELREQAVADGKIDELFGQMIQGFRDSNQITKISISQCSKCGSVLTGNAAKLWADKGVCSVCGYDVHKKV
jgi:hypothetical protein